MSKEKIPFIEIHVTNPNYEHTYRVREAHMSDWDRFMGQYLRGDTPFFTFTEANQSEITINPGNFASCTVTEFYLIPRGDGLYDKED